MAGSRVRVIVAASLAAVLIACGSGAHARGAGIAGPAGFAPRAPVHAGFVTGFRGSRSRDVRVGGNFGPVQGIPARGRAYYPSAPFGPFSVPFVPQGVVAPAEQVPPVAWSPPPYFGPPLFGEPGYHAHPVIYHIEAATPRTGRSVRERSARGTPWPKVVPQRF